MKPDPYEKGAKRYDRWIEPALRSYRLRGLKLAPGEPGMRVLDIGCGTGSHLALYKEQGCEVAGIENSPAMFAQAKAKLGDKIELHNADATAMPFKNDSFDLSILSMILHEVDPNVRDGLLQEAIRVTKKEGGLLITDYHPERKKGFTGWWKKALIFAVERKAGGDHYRNFRHFLANGCLMPLVDKHGLTIEGKRIVAGGNVGVFFLRKSY